jgi:hypothetical protein
MIASKKKENADFYFSFFFGINLLNKVEFLLFKSIIYLHRKKRRLITSKKKHRHYLSKFVMFWFNMSKSRMNYGLYPWAYLFTLESIFRLCRYFSRKKNRRRKKKLSSSQTSFAVYSFMTNYREAKKISSRIYFGWIRRFQGSIHVRIICKKWAAKSLDES